MPGHEWVNFATDILRVDDLSTHQDDPLRVTETAISRLFSNPVPPAVIYFPTALYLFTVSVEFPESVTVVMGSKAVLLTNDPGDGDDPVVSLTNPAGPRPSLVPTTIPEVILTFRCSVRADLLQIFGRYRPDLPPAQRVKPASRGVIVFLGNRMTELRPEWFGANGVVGGGEDNADAFNACIQAAHTDRLNLAAPQWERVVGGPIPSVQTTLGPTHDTTQPRWDPSIPVVLSSRYPVQKTLRVGSFAPLGVANPAPFVMRGEEGVGLGGGRSSIYWNLLADRPPLVRTLLNIRGEIGAVIDNVHFNANDFCAQSCVQMVATTVLDPKQTPARAPGAISSFRRCTFTGGTRNAVEIMTPVSRRDTPGDEWEPIGRVVFESCRFTSPRSAALPASVRREGKERVLLEINTSDQLGISTVGCFFGLPNETPNIRALGGKLFILSCVFHSYTIKMIHGLYRSVGKDLHMRSESDLRAVPTTLTMIATQSQSRNFMVREMADNGEHGWRGVTLVRVMSSDASPVVEEWEPRPPPSATPPMWTALEPAEITWKSQRPVGLAILSCGIKAPINVQAGAHQVLDMANSFYSMARDGNFVQGDSPVVVPRLLGEFT